MPSSADTVPALLAPKPAQAPVVLRGSVLAKVLMRAWGWQVDFDGALPGAQGVLIVYPHTSNWDFVWGVLAKWAIGFPLHFWGKASLFRLPVFGTWLRWIGGLPVERDAPRGAVGAMAERLRAARRDGRFMWLALSPEGTRRHQPAWRSGFYRVALQAGVPLAVASFDYPSRKITVHGFLELSGREEADLAAIRTALAGARGQKPEQAAPIRFDTPRE